ncbi:MAG: MFS transporter [Pseudomonadota bacterium]
MSASLGIRIAAVALPSLSTVHGGGTGLVVSFYILATTVGAVPLGRAGDVFERRRALLLGILAFILASLWASGAESLRSLILARAVQGLGAGATISLPLALACDLARAGRVGRAMGLIGSATAVGTAPGPALDGALIAAFDWRAVFLALAAVLLIARMPADGRRALRAPLDVAGSLLLAATLGALVLLIEAPGGGDSTASWPWSCSSALPPSSRRSGGRRRQ